MGSGGNEAGMKRERRPRKWAMVGINREWMPRGEMVKSSNLTGRIFLHNSNEHSPRLHKSPRLLRSLLAIAISCSEADTQAVPR